jgi:chemotaxis protein histidine kinase CheA
VYEEEIVQNIPIEIEMPDVNVDVAVMDEPVFEDLGFEPDVPIVEMPEEIEVMAEIETVVAEIEQIDSISQPELTEPIVEIETPTEEPTANETQAEATTEETTENEPVKEVVVEKSEPEPEPVEEKQEVVEEPQQEEGEEKQVAEEVKEEKQVEETKEEKKEVAQNDVKEKEPVQKNVKQEKQSKQEQKQAKAKEILNNLVDPYSSVAQMTTLALVNALGPNIKTYSAPVQTQPTWYESEEIYADVILQDPLGNYFGVRDSLTFNKMIDMQYE